MADVEERQSVRSVNTVSDHKVHIDYDKWVIDINEQLQGWRGPGDQGRTGETMGEIMPTIFRVRVQVRKMKPEHFSPEYMFMGLLHRKKYRNVSERHRSDEFRIKIVKAFLEIMSSRSDYDWDKLCSEVVDDPKTIQLRYGFSDLDSELVQRSLTLDAIFLVSYLVGYLFRENVETDKEKKLPFPTEPFREIMFEKGLSFHNTVANDLTKLENQIPLPLLRKVLELLCRDHPRAKPKHLLNLLCYKVIRMISFSIPGFHFKSATVLHSAEKIMVDFADADHLLGCVCSVIFRPPPSNETFHPESHRLLKAMRKLGWVRDWIQRWSSWKTKTKGARFGTRISDDEHLRTISLPSITKLYEAGIECRGETRGCTHIDLLPRFKKGLLKATLYIPRFSILYRTELLWRNMAAYEAAKLRLDDRFTSPFICFLKFMNEMIDTEEDVALLRQGRDPVIPKNRMGTEKDLAELFNQIVEHYMSFHGRATQWTDLRVEIDKFCKQRHRRMVLEFLRYNFGKPWLVISVFAATSLLALTILQTVYTILAFHSVY